MFHIVLKNDGRGLHENAAIPGANSNLFQRTMGALSVRFRVQGLGYRAFQGKCEVTISTFACGCVLLRLPPRHLHTTMKEPSGEG